MPRKWTNRRVDASGRHFVDSTCQLTLVAVKRARPYASTQSATSLPTKTYPHPTFLRIRSPHPAHSGAWCELGGLAGGKLSARREREQRLLYLLVPSASSGSVRGGLAVSGDQLAGGWMVTQETAYRWRRLRGAAKAASRSVSASAAPPPSHAEGMHSTGIRTTAL